MTALAGSMAAYTQQLQGALQAHVDQLAAQWQEVVGDYLGQFAQQWQAMLPVPAGAADLARSTQRPVGTAVEQPAIDLAASRQSLEALSQTLLQALGRAVEEMTQELHARGGVPVDAGAGAPATPAGSASPTTQAGG